MPFKTVSYEIIGDGPTTIYFGIDKTTGRVSLKSPLPSQLEKKYYVSILKLHNIFSLKLYFFKISQIAKMSMTGSFEIFPDTQICTLRNRVEDLI